MNPALYDHSPALALTGIEKQYRRWATPGSRLWVPLLYRLSHVFARGWPITCAAAHRRASTEEIKKFAQTAAPMIFFV